jgi:hypothetical protein
MSWGAELSFESWAGDFERESGAYRILVIDLARNKTGGKRQIVERNAAIGASESVERDADGCPASINVVQVKVKVRGNGLNNLSYSRKLVAFGHIDLPPLRFNLLF